MEESPLAAILKDKFDPLTNLMESAGEGGRWPRLQPSAWHELDKQTWNSVWVRDRERCRGCGLDLAGARSYGNVDHIQARTSFEEGDSAADRTDNLQILCKWCNADKSNYMHLYPPRPGITDCCSNCTDIAPECVVRCWCEFCGEYGLVDSVKRFF